MRLSDTVSAVPFVKGFWNREIRLLDYRSGRKMFSFVEEAAENVVKGNVDSMSWMAVAVLGVAVVVALVANLYLDSQPIQIFPPVYTEGLPVIGTPLSFAKGPIEFVKRGYAAVGDCFTIKVRTVVLFSQSHFSYSLALRWVRS